MPAAEYFPALSRQGVQTIRIIGSAPGDQQPLYYISLEAGDPRGRTAVWLSSG